MKHTPGPWRVDPDLRQDMEWNNHIYGADDMAVCFMAHSDGKDDERDQANAHLIAAAPDGYALAESIVRWYENAGDSDPDQESPGSIKLWRQAKAFLAKARGEA